MRLVSAHALQPKKGQTAMAKPNPLIELKSVTKRFGGLTAITDVSLQIRKGEIVCLVGSNAAGKSTTIKIISGVFQPDAGVLAVDGQAREFSSPADARASGIETVYQELALVDDMSVTANVCLGREITWGHGLFSVLNRKAMKSRAQEILRAVGVSVDSVSVSVRNLSGGQRQAVAIARAVGWGTRIVVLDEPTAALGVRETEHVEEIIKRMPESDVSVLLVNHNLDQVFRLANRMYVFRHGQIVGELETEKTTHNEVVSLITGT